VSNFATLGSLRQLKSAKRINNATLIELEFVNRQFSRGALFEITSGILNESGLPVKRMRNSPQKKYVSIIDVLFVAQFYGKSLGAISV
jgi:hypothetical protein